MRLSNTAGINTFNENTQERDFSNTYTGTNVSYAIHHDDQLMANSSTEGGVTPHNITLSVDVVQKLGLGCHNMTLTATNRIMDHMVSAGLDLCLLEPVEGLQASVVADDCPDSTDLIVSVSLERGSPVELVFTLTGTRDTLSETRDMVNGTIQTYTFSNPLEGTVE